MKSFFQEVFIIRIWNMPNQTEISVERSRDKEMETITS